MTDKERTPLELIEDFRNAMRGGTTPDRRYASNNGLRAILASADQHIAEANAYDKRVAKRFENEKQQGQAKKKAKKKAPKK